MFRFVLQVAFVRRMLRVRWFRFFIVFVFLATALAGIFYAAIMFEAIQQRSQTDHVQHHSSH